METSGDSSLLVVEYRPFRNSDTPNLVRLWHECELGWAAAGGFSCEEFDIHCLSQPYFDRNGLIVACNAGQIIGCVHATFGCNADESDVSHERGAIAVVMVAPEWRRQGIGRQLVAAAEAYLADSGTTTIQAGAAAPCDGFYVGLDGGSEPAGFLHSNTCAAPFLQALDYEPAERIAICQLDLERHRDPVSYRLSQIRRKAQMTVSELPPNPTWWWMTRFGRHDTLHFRLVSRTEGELLASLTIVGLELYIFPWQERTTGLVDLYVPEPMRRHGYAYALVTEVVRQLREELVTRVEAHCLESNTAALKLFHKIGFDQIDTGVIYRKKSV